MAGLGKEQPPWLKWSGVGMEFAAGIIGFALLGIWFDYHYKKSPWGVLVGMALGLIGSTYNLLKQSRAAFGTKKKDDDDSDHHA